MSSNWKKRSGSIAIASAILLMAALAVFSQGPDRPRRGFPGGPGGEGPRDGIGLLPRDLNLTQDQRAQIKKLTDSFEESTKSLRDQLKTLHESEPDPFSGTFDEATVCRLDHGTESSTRCQEGRICAESA